MLKNILQKSFFKNFSWMFFSKITQLASSFIVGVLVARHLGVSSYGTYSAIIAVTAIASNISAFGLNHLITKEVKAKEFTHGQILGSSIFIRVIVAILLAVLGYGLVDLFVDPKYRILILVILLGQIFLAAKVYEFYCLAFSKMKAFSIITAIVIIAFAILKALLVFFDAQLTDFLIILAVQPMLLGCLIFVYFHFKKISDVKLSIDKTVCFALVKKSFPLVLSSLTAIIYLKVDILMLASIKGEYEAGIYAVASRLSEIWYFIPTLIAGAAFPRMLELKRKSQIEYTQRLSLMMDIFCAMSVALALFFTLFSEIIITLLFGKEYVESAIVLSIHIWAGVFIFLRAIVNKWLISEDLYYLSFATHAFGAIGNILLNLYLIPMYGPIGAAIATVVSYALASYFSLFFVKASREMAYLMTSSLFCFPRLIARVIKK